jgi:hypothetical protein
MPVDGSWNHFRYRWDALRDGFPPPSTLEADALARDLTRYPEEFRVRSVERLEFAKLVPLNLWDENIPVPYSRILRDATTALEALHTKWEPAGTIPLGPPQAHDAAFAFYQLGMFTRLVELHPDDEIFRERLIDAAEVWKVFLAGYGCLGIYDGELLTYLVARGDSIAPPRKAKVPRVPRSSRGTEERAHASVPEFL